MLKDVHSIESSKYKLFSLKEIFKISAAIFAKYVQFRYSLQFGNRYVKLKLRLIIYNIYFYSLITPS